MGSPRIIIDTNVLISAFGWAGKPRLIFEKVLNKEFELIISKKQFNEIKRVLNYPKLKLTDEQKLQILNNIGSTAKIIETHNNLDIIKEDPIDNMFLEAAIEHNANFIITGDNHILRIKEFQGTKILTPADFLEEISKEKF